jgi:hypothetical protein
MASTFSTTLRLELIGDGDQSGIWGQTTNTNLGTLLEQAITGVVNITMTDANYTLSNFNGVSDEARNAVLVVGGTNAAVRDIIAPLVEKLYVIRNSTVGGFGIRIIGSSGTGVTVPSGATVWIYCDGTNFNAVGTESVGNFEVNGNLSVTGTTTLTGALGGSTAVFSGAISSVSPTFTGNPIAPTQTVTTNNTTLATTAFVRSIIPAGVILMWSGSIATIPSGWLLCDGTNSTPNLRDRFVIGAGSTYAVNATGGATTATLSTTNLPSHTHSLSASGTTSAADINHTHDGVTNVQSADHVHTYSAVTGGMNANVFHNHSITDPGHLHAQNGQTLAGVGSGVAGGTASQTQDLNTQTATTGITATNNANIEHTHSFSGTTAGQSASHNHTFTTGLMNSVNNPHTHTVTVTGTSGATGSGTAFSILPPYYALAYIMKS